MQPFISSLFIAYIPVHVHSKWLPLRNNGSTQALYNPPDVVDNLLQVNTALAATPRLCGKVKVQSSAFIIQRVLV